MYSCFPSEYHSPKVRTFMLDVMCPLISENDAVPPDLLEVILANLLDSKKAENPHAFQMAKELVKRTATSIEPSIQAVSITTCRLQDCDILTTFIAHMLLNILVQNKNTFLSSCIHIIKSFWLFVTHALS